MMCLKFRHIVGECLWIVWQVARPFCASPKLNGMGGERIWRLSD